MAKRNSERMTPMTDEKKLPQGVTEHQGTFSINVSGDDGVEIYSNKEEPYSYLQVDSLASAVNQFGGELADDAVSFLNDVFAGEKNQAAVKEIVDIVNGKLKANAKNSRYQSVMNQYKPMSEDDKVKAFDRMVDTFAKLNGVTTEVARKTLAALQPVTA